MQQQWEYKLQSYTEQHLCTFNDDSLQFTPVALGRCSGGSTVIVRFLAQLRTYRGTLKMYEPKTGTHTGMRTPVES